MVDMGLYDLPVIHFLTIAYRFMLNFDPLGLGPNSLWDIHCWHSTIRFLLSTTAFVFQTPKTF